MAHAGDCAIYSMPSSCKLLFEAPKDVSAVCLHDHEAQAK